MLRRIAALDPQLPPHLADTLTRDPDEKVRNLGARNERLPPERLQELLTDPNHARAAAANPAIALQDIHELLDRLDIPVH